MTLLHNTLTVCGQSGLPDPANDTAFNDLASFPTFNPDYFGLDFDPNNTDYDWSDFQRPAAENMTRAETERKLRVVGGVQAQPGEIRYKETLRDQGFKDDHFLTIIKLLKIWCKMSICL